MRIPTETNYGIKDKTESVTEQDNAASETPRSDANLTTTWTGFEKLLLEKFPATQRIATPSWEPIYEQSDWQEFLREQGYQPINSQAFLKPVLSKAEGEVGKK